MPKTRKTPKKRAAERVAREGRTPYAVCGFRERPEPNGRLTRTKALIAAAFKNWEIQNGQSRYSAWRHEDRELGHA